MRPPEIPERVDRILAAIADAGLGAPHPPETTGFEQPGARRDATCAHLGIPANSSSTRTNVGASTPGSAPTRRPRATRGRCATSRSSSPRTSSPSSAGTPTTPIPILAGTYAAAVGAVDVTLTAWEAVADGRERAAYVLRAPARSSRGRRLVRGLLLPQQRRDRGAGLDRPRRARRDRRRRLPPRQRHAADLLRPRRRALRVAARRSRVRVPVLPRLRGRTRLGRGRGLQPQLPAAGGHRLEHRSSPRCAAAVAVVRKFGPDARDRVARRRHRARGSRHASASSPTTTRASARRWPRSTDRRSSCKRAATASTCSAATSSAVLRELA